MSSGLKRKRIINIQPGLQAWLQLSKVLLCVPVALSSGFGYILFKKILAPALIFLIPGMLFLACGAACLNSIQEKDIDSRFRRTRLRPLVVGSISLFQAQIYCVSLLTAAFCCFLLLPATMVPMLLGLLGLLIYNGIYTPLKRYSSFALLIGGIAGALPPLIGWSAAGGSIQDIRILMIGALFFLWQVPHFFMILLQNKEEYKKNIATSLPAILPQKSLHRLLLIWILCYTVVSFSMTLPPAFLAAVSKLSSILTAALLTAVISLHLLRKNEPDYSFLFRIINSLFFLNFLIITGAELFF